MDDEGARLISRACCRTPRRSESHDAVQHRPRATPPPDTRHPRVRRGELDGIGVRLETDPHGLSPEEARRRLERDGPNQLAETPPTSPFVILLHLVATVVTLLLEEFIDAG